MQLLNYRSLLKHLVPCSILGVTLASYGCQSTEQSAADHSRSGSKCGSR